MKKMILIFLLLTLSLFSQDLTKIKLQLQWKHQFEFAGFYAAKEMGYYRDAGIDLDFLEYDGNSITDTVLSKKADFGLTYSSLIADYLQGKDVVFIANYFKQSPLVIVTQKDIKTPAQLRGKKVMGVSDNIDSITLKLMLEKFDITLDDIENIPTSYSVKEFVEKKVDAMAVFSTNEIYELDKLGVQYNLFNPSLYGQEYYDLNLFTSKEFALKNPILVETFKKATKKGWEYALKNKEKIAQLILKKYNTQNKTKEALLFEANQIEQLMFTKTEGIGSIDPLRVELIAKSFVESGYVNASKIKKLDSLLFDNSKQKYQNATTQTITLTQMEKEYLDTKENITMCVDPDWEPYEMIDRHGKHIGIAADFIKLVETKIDKKIKLIPTKSWNQSLQYLQERKCEILSFLNKTPKRDIFLNFTPPLYEEIEVIIAKNKVPYLDGFQSLKDKPIGIIKGYRTEEYIQKNYPEIKIKYIKNYEEGLQLISHEEIFATINSLLGTAHLIKKSNLFDIKIAGKTDLKNQYRIGITKNDLILHSILSKAVVNISNKEKNNVLDHWLSIRFDHYTNYSLLWKIIGGISIIILFLLYRDYAIRKINHKLEKKMQQQIKEMQEKDNLLQQQSKLAQMGEMLNMIAHQWRQPLAAISSTVITVDMSLESKLLHLKTKEEHEEYKKYLELKLKKMDTFIQTLSTTIDDFKNFFKQDNNKQIIHLQEPIEMALNIIEPSMKTNNYVDIIKEYQHDEKIAIYKNELMQVILNILKNAEDNFIEKNIKSPIIHIKIDKFDTTHTIKIYDNGGGIQKNIISKIFNPYFSTKASKNGSGIGLYMSKIIIEKHHKGKLLAYNHNDGVCFEIQLNSYTKSSPN